MLRSIYAFSPLALLLLPLGTLGDDKKPFDDAEFVKMAASGGMHEVELGKVAADKAKDPAVKEFGQKMVTDHGKVNEELKKMAKEFGFAVPDKMLEEHQKEFDRFKNLTGDQFDREYVKHMIKDHEEDVAEFTRASKEAKSPAVKAFALKTLPVIQEHLEAVKKLSRD